MSKTTQSKTKSEGSKKKVTKEKQNDSLPDETVPISSPREDTPASSPRENNIARNTRNNGSEVLHETNGIISMVKGLEEQVEMAFMLKEVLEKDLETTQNRLEEELEKRAHLEVQVETLQIQVGQIGQLREDVSFVETERTRLADKLAELDPALTQTTEARDALAEQLAAAETRLKGLETDKATLEGRVMNLKDKLVDTDRLYQELEDVGKSYQELREHMHEQDNRLQAAQDAKEAMQRELAGAHGNSRSLKAESEEMREKLSGAHGRTTDLQIALDDERASNRNLIETNTRLENDLKRMTIDHDAAAKELDAFKNAMREIRNEADQTSGRVRRRYNIAGESEGNNS